MSARSEFPIGTTVRFNQDNRSGVGVVVGWPPYHDRWFEVEVSELDGYDTPYHLHSNKLARNQPGGNFWDVQPGNATVIAADQGDLL